MGNVFVWRSTIRYTERQRGMQSAPVIRIRIHHWPRINFQIFTGDRISRSRRTITTTEKMSSRNLRNNATMLGI